MCTFVLSQPEVVAFHFPYCHLKLLLTLLLSRNDAHEDLSQQVKFSSDPEQVQVPINGKKVLQLRFLPFFP